MADQQTTEHWKPDAADQATRERVLEIASSAHAIKEKNKFSSGFSILAQLGVVAGLYEGLYGHMSLRVPGASDYFWVNPTGIPFSRITPDHLVLLSGDGKILHGRGMHNFAAFFIHSSIHAARPDVNCIVHTHPRAGCAFAALGRYLEPIDQVGCSFFEDHALHHDYTGVVEGHEQGKSIVASLGNARSAILINHGLLTCASTVEQAVIDMFELERTCEVQLNALATGRDLLQIPVEIARQVRRIRTEPRRYLGEWMVLMSQLEATFMDASTRE